MSDNVRRYRAIKNALLQLQPVVRSGRIEQSLCVLAMFINGIVASKSTHTRAVAKKAPSKAKVTSREKQLSRWYQNERVTYTQYMLPFVRALLQGFTWQSLVLVIDGSEVGRNCVTLMVSLVYRKRAIPLVWIVRRGKKGHFPADTHIELLRTLQSLLPERADVILLGDGEFDSVGLQSFVQATGWSYVCRTAKSTQVGVDGAWTTLDEYELAPGDCLPLYDVMFTQQSYGPVMVILWWQETEQEPIYLVTNLPVMEEACHYYKRRMRIETFFSDQKSRGFHLNQSHISEPERLARLMIATCLAYIWIIYLGVVCQDDSWVHRVHRTDRCDLSLFQLGMDLLEYFLNECLPIPVSFQLDL